MSISIIVRKTVLLFIMSTFTLVACGSRALDAHYKDPVIQFVQLVDARQDKIGGNVPYLKLMLETEQDLTALTKGLLQFRAHVVLDNGERFLALGMPAVEETVGYFVPYIPKQQNDGKKTYRTFAVFFFHKLIFDYDGNLRIDLLNDPYKQIEFDVSYRIFSGPQLARSRGLTVTREDFLRYYRARKTDAAPVILRLE